MELTRIANLPADKRIDAYKARVTEALEAARPQQVKEIISFITSHEMAHDSERYWVIPNTLAFIVEYTEDKAGNLKNNIDLDDVPDVVRTLLKAAKECQKQDEDMALNNVIIGATALLSEALNGLEQPVDAAEVRLGISPAVFPSSLDYIKFALPACTIFERGNVPSLLPYASSVVKAVNTYEKEMIEKEGAHVVDVDPLLLSASAALAAVDVHAGAYLDAASKLVRVGQYTNEQLEKAQLTPDDAQASLAKGLAYLCVCRRVPIREALLAKCCEDPRLLQHPLYSFANKIRNEQLIRKVDVEEAKATSLLPSNVLDTTSSSISTFEMNVLEHNLNIYSQKVDSLSLSDLQVMSGLPSQTLDEAISSLCFTRRIAGSLNQKKNVLNFFKDEDSQGNVSPAMAFWNKKFAALCDQVTSNE